VSENGPREGTRDLPRPGPETGRRAVEEDSPAGVAYGTLSRALRRRRAELVALSREGTDPAEVARRYGREHPLEKPVTMDEIESALAGAAASIATTSARTDRARGRSA
jgi:hypothetical protein